MAEHSTPLNVTLPAGGSNRPLLAALTRWWSPAATAPDADAMLGYESAHPWALGEDDAAERGDTAY